MFTSCCFNLLIKHFSCGISTEHWTFYIMLILTSVEITVSVHFYNSCLTVKVNCNFRTEYVVIKAITPNLQR